MARTALVATCVCVLLAAPASARWKAEYTSQPQEVRDWYANAELTPAAKGRFPFKNCCARSEVVRTQFRVSNADGADQWWWLDGDEWRRVPPDVIHWNEHAPDKQPTLFVWSGRETCFFPPEEGG